LECNAGRAGAVVRVVTMDEEIHHPQSKAASARQDERGRSVATIPIFGSQRQAGSIVLRISGFAHTETLASKH
jgi:hypothetical protein